MPCATRSASPLRMPCRPSLVERTSVGMDCSPLATCQLAQQSHPPSATFVTRLGVQGRTLTRSCVAASPRGRGGSVAALGEYKKGGTCVPPFSCSPLGDLAAGEAVPDAQHGLDAALAARRQGE